MPITKQEVLKIAKRYTSKLEFRQKEPYAYHLASRSDWLEDVTGHMAKNHAGRKLKLTKEVCKSAAKRFQTIRDFRREEHCLYVTAHRRGWLTDCTSHMTRLRKPRKKPNE